jgi:parallel beta-helix repeat protein
LHNALIQDNYFTKHFNAAIVLTGTVAPVSDVQIVHNESVDDSSIALFATTNVVVDYNKVVRSDGTAIFIGGGVNAADISYNNLADGTGNGISLRTDVGPTTNVVVKSNKISGFVLNGIRIGDGATNNTLSTNRSDGNGFDGIRAAATSANNVLKNNSMRGNAEHDCHDDSVGPYNPPALVANQWINDLGFTENKAGLCKHATVT